MQKLYQKINYPNPYIRIGRIIDTDSIKAKLLKKNSYSPSLYMPLQFIPPVSVFETPHREGILLKQRLVEFPKKPSVQPELIGKASLLGLKRPITDNEHFQASSRLDLDFPMTDIDTGSSLAETLDFRKSQNNEKAIKLYESLGIKQKIPSWSKNIKHWFSSNAYSSVSTFSQFRGVEQVVEPIKSLPHIQQIRSGQKFTLLASYCMGRSLTNRQNNFFSIHPLITASPFKISDELFHQRLKILVQQRESIEKYFRVPENSPDVREYVIERLKQLQGNIFAQYQHDGGASYNAQPWNSLMPRDSDILSWIFFKLIMCFSFPPSNDRIELAKQFVTFYPNYPPAGSPNKEDVWFNQSNPEKFEPHWEIYSRGEPFYCISGRNN